jgi:hypothetical protein
MPLTTCPIVVFSVCPGLTAYSNFRLTIFKRISAIELWLDYYFSFQIRITNFPILHNTKQTIGWIVWAIINDVYIERMFSFLSIPTKPLSLAMTMANFSNRSVKHMPYFPSGIIVSSLEFT